MAKNKHFDSVEEIALIDRARNGDNEAFTALYNQFRPVVERVHNNIRPPRREADDTVNDTFLQAWTHLPQFREDAKFSTWLIRIATNVCFDALRKSKVRREIQEADMSDEQRRHLFVEGNGITTKSPEKQIADSQLIQRAFGSKRIDPLDASLVIRKDAMGQTIEEIAEETGLKDNTIKVKIFRCRRRLQEQFSKINSSASTPLMPVGDPYSRIA